MKWLHISDIHVGRSHTQQSNALRLIGDAIDQFCPSPMDLILLTGDLSYSGQGDQFQTFENQVLSSVKLRPNTASAKIICVPGNHDIDCGEVAASRWDLVGQKHTFFSTDADGARVRRPYSRGLAAYEAFVHRTQVTSLLPQSECAVTVELPQQLDTLLILVCTTFLAHKDLRDERAPFPTEAVRALLQRDSEKRKHLLVVGHHPLTYHTPESADRARTLFDDYGALYLHGHEHTVSARCTTNGLHELGFGAAYANGPDQNAAGAYRNSVAFCAIDASGLHVLPVHWTDKGRWVIQTDVPTEFRDKSALWEGAYLFKLAPGFRSRQPSAVVKTRKLVCIEPLTLNSWTLVLQKARLLSQNSQLRAQQNRTAPPAAHWAVGKHPDGRDALYYLYSGVTPLSLSDLQTINMQVDIEGYSTCILACTGSLDDEAKSVANQLREKGKGLYLYTPQDLANALSSYAPQANEDPEQYIILLRDKQYFASVSLDGTYAISDELGVPLGTSDAMLGRLQSGVPEFASKKYVGSADPHATRGFQRDEYLDICGRIFNEVKYAALAGVGVRLTNARLTDVYVEATADHSAVSDDEVLSRLIDEHLDSLSLSDQQRTLLESQLRQHYGLLGGSETNEAQAWYRRFSHLFVLGDPGAGKSCLVKREVLAYCKCESPWHTDYLPVYVSLSELENSMRMLEKETLTERSLREAIAAVCANRGMHLPEAVIEEHLAQGRIALFFDGLDEIAALDFRSTFLDLFTKLFTSAARLGNRFVLTSRPAAAMHYDAPEALRKINLRGLNDREMRQLATRVLSLGPNGEAAELSQDNALIVERLLADCERTPSLRRLARNPLLLTLIVFVYSNQGPPAARRHRLYTQAVQTLVSARNREEAKETLSEGDLRRRLGRLAIATYFREIEEIPTQVEAVDVISKVLIEDGIDAMTATADAKTFLENVARSTGLLILTSRPGAKSTVAFMHQSFREYYAATFLSENRDKMQLSRWRHYSRWQDVITLLAGLLSDSSDTSLFFDELLKGSESEKLTGSHIVFALECAIECDVPPERVQRRLYEAVLSDLDSGPAACDPSFRTELASHLVALARNAGISPLESCMLSALTSDETQRIAAAIELSCLIHRDIPIPKAMSLVRSLFNRTETQIRVACCNAIRLAPELRDDAAKELLKDSLERNIAIRQSALTALVTWKEPRASLENILREISRGSNTVLAGMSAALLLDQQEVHSVPDNEIASRLNDLLELLQNTSRPVRAEPDIVVSNGVAVSLAAATEPTIAQLGFRLLATLDDDAHIAYGAAMASLRAFGTTIDSDKALWALLPLVHNENARKLLTIKDRDYLVDLFSKAKRRDIKISLLKVLRGMRLDEWIVEVVAKHARTMENASGYDLREYRMTIATLHAQVKTSEASRQSLNRMACDFLRARRHEGWPTAAQDRARVLIESIADTCDEHDSLVKELWECIENYKVPVALRRASVRALCSGMPITSSNLSRLLGAFKLHATLEKSTTRAVVGVIRRAHQSMEATAVIFGAGNHLQDYLTKAWNSRRAQLGPQVDDYDLRNLRSAMIDTLEICSSYQEYSERALASSN